MATPDNAASDGTAPYGLSEVARIVRRHDPDRFFTALFAPAERRETLFALYAFNHELARAREMAAVPHMALIRLQWWRDVVEAPAINEAARRHPVAEALVVAVAAGALQADTLPSIIDAREAEVEPEIATFGDWRAYLLGTAGGLMVAAGQALGAPEPEALRSLGAAYGVAGVLRAVAAHARQGRCLLPADVLAEHGLSPEAVIGGADPTPVMNILAAEGRGLLRQEKGLRVPRRAIAAVLPAILARRDLARALPPGGPRGLGDRIAVTWAGLTGHLGLASV